MPVRLQDVASELRKSLRYGLGEDVAVSGQRCNGSIDSPTGSEV